MVEVELDVFAGTATVLQVVQRSKAAYRATVTHNDSGVSLALPTDNRDGTPIILDTAETDGQLVTVEITTWSEPRRGHVLERHTNTAGSIIISSAITRGFSLGLRSRSISRG